MPHYELTTITKTDFVGNLIAHALELESYGWMHLYTHGSDATGVTGITMGRPEPLKPFDSEYYLTLDTPQREEYINTHLGDGEL